MGGSPRGNLFMIRRHASRLCTIAAACTLVLSIGNANAATYPVTPQQRGKQRTRSNFPTLRFHTDVSAA